MKSILGYAVRRPLRSVAIPGLGMGTGGLAADRAARIFADAIASHAAVETQPARVRVVLEAPVWHEPALVEMEPEADAQASAGAVSAAGSIVIPAPAPARRGARR